STGLRIDLGERAPRRGGRLLSFPCRRLRGPCRGRTRLPHRPRGGAGTVVWPSLAHGRGPVGGRQSLGRTGRDRTGSRLSPGRVRHVRLAVYEAHTSLRGVTGHTRARLARRAVRLRRKSLQGEGRPAAAAAGTAGCAAAVDRRRRAQGARPGGALPRRPDRGAALRTEAPDTADPVLRRGDGA